MRSHQVVLSKSHELVQWKSHVTLRQIMRSCTQYRRLHHCKLPNGEGRISLGAQNICHPEGINVYPIVKMSLCKTGAIYFIYTQCTFRHCTCNLHPGDMVMLARQVGCIPVALDSFPGQVASLLCGLGMGL